MQAGFTTFHYAILGAYVALSLGVGLWFARNQDSVAGYFLAERSAPWWAVAISIIASDITAISYLGVAAIVFTGDLQLSVATMMYPLGAVCVALLFVPYLARQNVFTVYEYLERRFNAPVRTVASALFLFTRGSHLAVALFATALVVEQVFGLPIWAALVVLGGLTTVYTVFGGMKAVIWTDVVQFFVLMGGLVAVIAGVAMAFDWDFARIWHLASGPSPAGAPWLHGQPGPPTHTRVFQFHFDYRTMNFWALVVSSFLGVVGSMGSDQVLVQRYLAAGSRRKMAQSLIAGGLITVPVNAVIFGTGVFLVAYYTRFLGTPGHAWVGGLVDANRVMTHFLSHGLPGTLGALVIAGLFAGTMSSFSAGLNSLGTAVYVDFVTRFGRNDRSAVNGVRLAKVITALVGATVIVAAMLVGGDETILAILMRVMSPFAGPLLGMFLLGMLSSRANSFGVVGGAICGAAAAVYVTYFTALHWLWYFPVGCTVGLGAGYLLSYLRPAPASAVLAAAAAPSAS